LWSKAINKYSLYVGWWWQSIYLNILRRFLQYGLKHFAHVFQKDWGIEMTCLLYRVVQKKWDHYVWRLTSAYIFKTLELISVIFGTLLCCFLLNISVEKFIKFILQSSATWQKITTWISHSINAMRVQHKTFSRISLDILQNRIDCSSVLKKW